MRKTRKFIFPQLLLFLVICSLLAGCAHSDPAELTRERDIYHFDEQQIFFSRAYTQKSYGELWENLASMDSGDGLALDNFRSTQKLKLNNSDYGSETRPLSLQSLKYFPNLTFLEINGPVTDFEAVGELAELETLKLYDVKLDSLGALARLPALQSLHISYCEIADSSALGELRQLTDLEWWGPSSPDMESLATLPQLTSLTWHGDDESLDMRPFLDRLDISIDFEMEHLTPEALEDYENLRFPYQREGIAHTASAEGGYPVWRVVFSGEQSNRGCTLYLDELTLYREDTGKETGSDEIHQTIDLSVCRRWRGGEVGEAGILVNGSVYGGTPSAVEWTDLNGDGFTDLILKDAYSENHRMYFWIYSPEEDKFLPAETLNSIAGFIRIEEDCLTIHVDDSGEESYDSYIFQDGDFRIFQRRTLSRSSKEFGKEAAAQFWPEALEYNDGTLGGFYFRREELHRLENGGREEALAIVSSAYTLMADVDGEGGHPELARFAVTSSEGRRIASYLEEVAEKQAALNSLIQ